MILENGPCLSEFFLLSSSHILRNIDKRLSLRETRIWSSTQLKVIRKKVGKDCRVTRSGDVEPFYLINGHFFRFWGEIFHWCHRVILAICSTFLFYSFDSAAALLEKPTQSAWFEYFSYFRQPLKAGVMFMSDIQQVKPAALHGTQQQAIW